MATVLAIILTLNEEKHIQRAVESVRGLATEVFVVDSFSTDQTVRLAQEAGARVVQRKFSNYARQFSWAIDASGSRADWIIRLDADEYFEPDLVQRLVPLLDSCPRDVTGINLKRKHIFMGRWIRFGGRYPLILLRIWRRGTASIEDRWMDEHMVLLEGRAVTVNGGFADENLNSLSFFTEKHNKYATREAIDVLIDKYRLIERQEEIGREQNSIQAAVKRWMKLRIYNKLPLWLGPGLYFLFRYIVQLGFLDGREGQIYHFLQGFWYRFLVAAKVEEFDRSLKSLSSAKERLTALTEITGHSIVLSRPGSLE